MPGASPCGRQEKPRSRRGRVIWPFGRDRADQAYYRTRTPLALRPYMSEPTRHVQGLGVQSLPSPRRPSRIYTLTACPFLVPLPPSPPSFGFRLPSHHLIQEDQKLLIDESDSEQELQPTWTLSFPTVHLSRSALSTRTRAEPSMPPLPHSPTLSLSRTQAAEDKGRRLSSINCWASPDSMGCALKVSMPEQRRETLHRDETD